MIVDLAVQDRGTVVFGAHLPIKQAALRERALAAHFNHPVDHRQTSSE
jgi:hypothetical protein